MAFKFVILASVLAAANGGLLPTVPLSHSAALTYDAAHAHVTPLAYSAVPHPASIALAAHAAPVAKAIATKEVNPDFDPNPQYSYAYDVQDGITGDSKQHHESRDGDLVQGSYSLLEADGTRRIVDYTADPVNGFNAVVHKEPGTTIVKAAAAAAPVAYNIPYLH